MKALEKLISQFNLPSPSQRREVLLNRMESDDLKKWDCKNCIGHCCTMISNSMKIDVLEAVDLYCYLLEKGMWNDKLKESLKETISTYRLDYEIVLSRGQEFRRTYTCPFYGGHNLGCSISPSSKPYGCLAFNPDKKGVSEWGHCSSRSSLMEKREVEFGEDESKLIDYLCDELNLPTEKKPIPVALLNLELAIKNYTF
ncbi:MAG: hypothetical protein ACO20H_08705 [Bacteriovoracaceae bacterium]